MVFAENKVLVSFADHDYLSHFLVSSPWTEKTAMASFQLDWCVDLAIVPITRLTSQCSHQHSHYP